MPISKELMLAILAMDAYNRGYNAGIKSPGAGLNQGLLGNQIGTATIGRGTEFDTEPNSVAASFFAISYSFGGKAPAGLANQTVISCRGTDARLAGAIP